MYGKLKHNIVENVTYMVKDFFTEWEVAEILHIDEDSAFELLEGVIEFEEEELYILAKCAGVPIERLIRR